MIAQSGQRGRALVGREHERRCLSELLDRTIAGTGALVLVDGEAGIGKTTLVDALAHDAVDHDITVVYGHGYELTSTTPYSLWIDLTRRQTASDSRWSALNEVLEPLTSPALASQDALFQQVGAMLAAIAERPLLIVLEDLQWADQASLEMLRSVVHRLHSASIMIAATYRTDDLSRHHPLYQVLPALVREARAERISLQPLDRAGISAIVREQFILANEDEERLVEYLVRQTEGNPLFLRELLRALVVDDVLHLEEDGWKVESLDQIVVPPLIEQFISSRLLRLSDETRQFLSVAAVIGQVVPYDLWRSVLDCSDEGLSSSIHAALDAHLLDQRLDGQHLAFTHTLIREVLYEGLVIPERRTWHRQIAEQLLAVGQPDPDIVATHLLRASDARAVPWLIQAGNQAQRAYALRMAADRFQTAIKLIGTPEEFTADYGWLLYRTARLMRFADPESGITYLESAERVGQAIGDPLLEAYAVADRGLMRCFSGDLQHGLVEIEQGTDQLARLAAQRVPVMPEVAFWIADDLPSDLALADRRADDQKRAELIELRWGAHVAWTAIAGHFQRARELGEHYLPRYRASPAGVLGGLGISYAALGEPDRAREALRRARDVVMNAKNYVMAGQFAALELDTVHLRFETDDLEARRSLQRGVEHAWNHSVEALPAGGPRSYVPVSVLVLEGQWAEAQHLARIEFTRGFRMNRPRAAVALIALAVWRGECDAAERYIRSLLPDGPATRPGNVDMLAALEAQRLAAGMELDRGNAESARSWIDAHDAWLEWSGAVADRAPGHLLHAAYLQHTGSLEQATEQARKVLASASNPRQPLSLLAAHRLHAELLIELGQGDEAGAHVAVALELAEACEAVYERALTLLARAWLHATQESFEQASGSIDEAQAVLSRLEARPALERARALAQEIVGRSRMTVPQVQQSSKPSFPARLTVREAEILRLLATGLSNREMADSLGLSIRTIERHVSNIYYKIDAHSRVDATAFAFQHDLL